MSSAWRCWRNKSPKLSCSAKASRRSTRTTSLNCSANKRSSSQLPATYPISQIRRSESRSLDSGRLRFLDAAPTRRSLRHQLPYASLVFIDDDRLIAGSRDAQVPPSADNSSPPPLRRHCKVARGQGHATNICIAPSSSRTRAPWVSRPRVSWLAFPPGGVCHGWRSLVVCVTTCHATCPRETRAGESTSPACHPETMPPTPPS